MSHSATAHICTMMICIHYSIHKLTKRLAHHVQLIIHRYLQTRPTNHCQLCTYADGYRCQRDYADRIQNIHHCSQSTTTKNNQSATDLCIVNKSQSNCFQCNFYHFTPAEAQSAAISMPLYLSVNKYAMIKSNCSVSAVNRIQLFLRSASHLTLMSYTVMQYLHCKPDATRICTHTFHRSTIVV